VTPLQRRRIQQAIRDGHLAFLAEVFGPGAVDPDDYDRLRATGKVRDDGPLPQDALLAAHALGTLAGHEQVGAAPREVGKLLSSPDAFWRHLGDDPQIATEAEREAMAVLRDRIGQHVRALGNKLEDIVGHALVDADDRARRRRLSGRAPADARADAREVVARIRAAVGALRRDWLRVAHTEIHNAAEEAKAVAMAGRDPDHDPRVFKRPRRDACAFCRLLYLKPDGVTPRVFRLSALLANGTNAGRRAGRPTRSGKSRTELRAVVGSVHPFCRCELFALADGMGFDDRGRVAYVGARKSMSIEVERPDEELAAHDCEDAR